MPEGGIAHIMCQTGRRDDRSDATPMRRILIVRQATRYVVAQTASHAAHLQTMRQAVVHKDILRQGEDLRFVLQSAKWCREDQTIVVSVKLRAHLHAPRELRSSCSKASVRDQLIPIHPTHYI